MFLNQVIDLLEERVPGQPWIELMRSGMSAAEFEYDAAQTHVDREIGGQPRQVRYPQSITRAFVLLFAVAQVILAEEDRRQS